MLILECRHRRGRVVLIQENNSIELRQCLAEMEGRLTRRLEELNECLMIDMLNSYVALMAALCTFQATMEYRFQRVERDRHLLEEQMDAAERRMVSIENRLLECEAQARGTSRKQ